MAGRILFWRSNTNDDKLFVDSAPELIVCSKDEEKMVANSKNCFQNDLIWLHSWLARELSQLIAKLRKKQNWSQIRTKSFHSEFTKTKAILYIYSFVTGFLLSMD